jgi:hypothetical protein
MAGVGASAVVLVVADVVAPVGGGVLVVDLVECEMDHQSVGGGAVPVLLVGLDVDAVAGLDDLDGAAAALAQADALGDEQALSEGWRCQAVRAPGMKWTRLACTRDGAVVAATGSM